MLLPLGRLLIRRFPLARLRSKTSGISKSDNGDLPPTGHCRGFESLPCYRPWIVRRVLRNPLKHPATNNAL